MVDGEPVAKRPCVDSARVTLVTGSDERYTHTCDLLAALTQ